MFARKDPAIFGIYYMFGNNTYFQLPANWVGSCCFSFVFPKIYHVSEIEEKDTGMHGRSR